METIKAALIKGFTEGWASRPNLARLPTLKKRWRQSTSMKKSAPTSFVAEIDNPGSSDQVLEGTHTGAGGTIDAFVKLEGPTHGILQRVLISGDFFVTPPRIVFDLEAHLLGTRLDDVETTIGSSSRNRYRHAERRGRRFHGVDQRRARKREGLTWLSARARRRVCPGRRRGGPDERRGRHPAHGGRVPRPDGRSSRRPAHSLSVFPPVCRPANCRQRNCRRTP